MNQLLLNFLPVLATFLIGISYLPQLKVTYTTKNVEGQSIMFWIILISALFINVLREFYLFYSSGTYGGLLTQGLNFALALAMLIGILLYKKK